MGNTGYKVNPNILFWIRLKTLTTNNDVTRILEVAYIYTDIQLTTSQMGSHIVLRSTHEHFLTADHHQLKYFFTYPASSKPMDCTMPVSPVTSKWTKQKNSSWKTFSLEILPGGSYLRPVSVILDKRQISSSCQVRLNATYA